MAIQKKMLAEPPASIEKPTAPNPSLRPDAEAVVTDAIHRVYRRYGQNLSAFFNDVRQEGAHSHESAKHS